MVGMLIWCICVIIINIVLICLQVYLVKQKPKYGYILPTITFVYSIIHMFTNGVGTNNIMPIPLYFLGINIITFILLGICFFRKRN